MGAHQVTTTLEATATGSGGIAPNDVTLTPNALFQPLFPSVRLVVKSEATQWGSIRAQPAWVTEVGRQLGLLVRLRPGWDGAHAPAISLNVVQAALDFLSLGLRSTSPAPALVPVPDGGLQLEWHLAATEVEIYLDCSGRASAWGRDDRDEWEEDVVSASWASLNLQRLLDQPPGNAA
jgi:hypothetical protein